MSLSSANRTTEYRYNLDGRLVELTAHNEVTGDQVTRWVYGTSLAESGVASNDLVREKIYPDDDGTSDRVEYTYNRQGQLSTLTDQNGTVHGYSYDELGRLTLDAASIPAGSGVDDAVLAIGLTYEVRGMVNSVTSYHDLEATDAVNGVLISYNGFGQVSSEAQSHSGEADAGAPAVSYSYESVPGAVSRPTGVSYPDGWALSYNYGEVDSIDDLLSRIAGVWRVTGGDLLLAGYTRRGANATVRIEYGEPGVEMTYIKAAGEPVGDAGDQYTGLDRFNRIEDIRWQATETGTLLDRFQYGFDRAGNRTWRRNLTAPDASFDEAYQYDGLYQLTNLARGRLNLNDTAPCGIAAWQEAFTYDPTGNWERYRTLTDGGTPFDQSRKHNTANEITAMRAIGGPASAVGYDGAGNMTTMPPVGRWGGVQSLVFDAWNRLVKVEEDSATVAEYAYDGLTRRIAKTTNAGSTTRDYYYSNQWQVLEERLNGATGAERRFVWGLRYLDDLVLRDQVSGSTTTRLYVTHDQWHVTGLLNTSAAVQERYAYHAFGESEVLAPDFTPRSTSSFGWEIRFGAYRWDAETGLYQVRYRYLHPVLGRWLSRDPFGEDGGENLYRYSNNVPTNFVDVFGLITMYGFGNCMGYAITGSEGVYITPKGEALDKFMERLGFKCKYTKTVKDCQCACENEKVIVVIYLPRGEDPKHKPEPWSKPNPDEWGKPYDFHCIRGKTGCSNEYLELMGNTLQHPDLKPRNCPESSIKFVNQQKKRLCCCRKKTN